MDKQIVEAVQTRLRSLDWYSGKVDGAAGPRTAAAVVDFKRAIGFNPRPFVGVETMTALFAPDAPRKANPKPTEKPAWLIEAERHDGAHEVRDRSKLMAWLSKGLAAIDPAKTPWCGAFVRASFAYTLPDEPVPANALAARSWLSFGVKLDRPALGAVVVFWRGTPAGWQGHVGFVVGEDAKNVMVRGGNQGDQNNVRSFPKSRVLGYRWPSTVPMPNANGLAPVSASETTGEA